MCGSRLTIIGDDWQEAKGAGVEDVPLSTGGTRAGRGVGVKNEQESSYHCWGRLERSQRGGSGRCAGVALPLSGDNWRGGGSEDKREAGVKICGSRPNEIRVGLV
jgi:hypothetical protein